MKRNNSTAGYVLTVVIMMLALVGILVGAELFRQSTKARIIKATQTRSEAYLSAEEGITHTLAWFRINSQKIAYPYRRENYYNSFRETDPSVGVNDTTDFTVPTIVKNTTTNDSFILASDATLASPKFPYTADITTNQVFDTATEFQNADVGDAKVRVTLLSTNPIIPSKDYGPPPNPTPETDFYPTYRVDSMTDIDRGAHVHAIIGARLLHRFDVGIYGEDYLEISQPCDSYLSSQGQYSTGIRRANCPAGSNSTAAVHKNEEVYGSLKTNGSIDADPPYGGQTCADFQSGCPNKGETCTGQDCGVPLLDQFHAWDYYCPQSQAATTISGTVTLEITQDDPMHKCWDSVTIQTGSKLILKTSGIPYFIKTLTFKNNSNSVLEIQPATADKTIELYVLTITGSKFNGNQMFNMNGKPINFILNYLGTDPLVLDGTAKMNAALVSPNAAVTVSGSFEYSGSLLARQLVLTGSGGIHYDEDLGGTGPVVDVQYRIKDWVQYYR